MHVTTTELPQGKPNKDISVKQLYKKMGEMASSWKMNPETGPETLLKAKIAVFAVLVRKLFNTAVFCPSCTNLRQQSSKWVQDRTSGKNSLRTLKKICFWKHCLFSGQISCKYFSLSSDSALLLRYRRTFAVYKFPMQKTGVVKLNEAPMR